MSHIVLATSAAQVWRPTGVPIVMLEAGERGAVATGTTTSGFAYERDPAPEHVAALRAVSEKRDDAGWLYLHWESGDPWIPAQRWTLYEMLHEDFVDFDILEQLDGPHPRSEGHICTSLPTHAWALSAPTNYQPCYCRRKTEGWRGGPAPLITLTQWTLWRKTGYYGTPFWIIQGTTGGHKWGFTDQESRILRMEGLPDQPPMMGQLPYAPYDDRVTRQIVKCNKLLEMGMEIGEFKRTMGPGFEQHKQRIEQQMRANWIDFLKIQVQDLAEMTNRAAKKGTLDALPRTSIDYERLDEQNDAHYVETGRVLHPSEMT